MWPTAPLEELVEINPKWAMEVEPQTLVSFVPMRSVGAMNGQVDTSQVLSLAETKKGLTRFCEGDVLLAKITPSMENGKVAVARGLANGLGVGTTEFHVLRPRALDPKFLMYYFFQDWVREDLRRHMKGTAGQLRVPASYLSEIQIPKPSTEEQELTIEEIEKQFTRLDAAYPLLQRARANLGRYRASVLSWAAHSATRGREVQLGELAWDVGYGTSVKCDYDFDGPPVLRIPNIVRGSIDLSDMKFARNTDRLDESERVEPGDFLIVRTNGSKDLIGRGAIVLTPFSVSTFFASYLIRFRFSDESVAKWVGLVWDSPFVREQILAGAATSAGQYNVNLKSLSRIRLQIPEQDEREEIVREMDRRLSILTELSREVERSMRRARRLQQSILSSAFSGQLLKPEVVAG